MTETIILDKASLWLNNKDSLSTMREICERIGGGRLLYGYNTVEGIEFDIDANNRASKRAVWRDSLIKNDQGDWDVLPYGPDVFRDGRGEQ